jgi:hypothetical protein
MEVPTPSIWKTSSCLDATAIAEFACPDLTTFCRPDELGLIVTGSAARAESDVPGLPDSPTGPVVPSFAGSRTCR